MPNSDSKRLVKLAKAATEHEHGTMLVISSDANGEAERLVPQAWAVVPAKISEQILIQLTKIDGAILLDCEGHCHAVGVILDGPACGVGDPSRGSRYNNVVRYLDGSPPPVVIVVYSSDGNIDIFPKLNPLISRHELSKVIRRFREAASKDSPDFEQVSRAWDDVLEKEFYLSEIECGELNELQERVAQIRKQKSSIWIKVKKLQVDSRMDDSYFLE